MLTTSIIFIVIVDLILVIIVMLKLIEVVVLPCLMFNSIMMFSVFKKTETKFKIYHFCLLTRFL